MKIHPAASTDALASQPDQGNQPFGKQVSLFARDLPLPTMFGDTMPPPTPEITGSPPPTS